MAPFLLALLVGGCGRVRIAEHHAVRLADDSEALQRIIQIEAQLQKSEPRLLSPAKTVSEEFHGSTPPRRRVFLNELASAPGFEIDVPTDAVILGESGCGCILHAIATTQLVKMRVTSGPFLDRSGWVCEDQVRRLVMLP